MVLDFILNPVLSPLLSLEPIFAIFLISVTISFTITLVYKKLTDQDLMKSLKAEIKELQQEMKKLRKDPEKMMQVQKQAMETNTKYMMHSMKPTLFTFIPIIIIFGWLNSHMVYFPLTAGSDFTATIYFEEGTEGNVAISVPEGLKIVKGGTSQDIAGNKVEWVLSGVPGEYQITYSIDGKEVTQDVIITDSIKHRIYAPPVVKGDPSLHIEKLTLSNEKIRPFQRVPVLNSIPWISNFGWLGTYITFSILSSIIIRKLMKVA